MNAKRQTIWLVSMLSLMVVLSAYYLFTEDSSKLNEADNAAQTQEIKVDTTQTDPNAVATDETVSEMTDGAVAITSDSNKAAVKTTDKTAVKSDTVQKKTDDQVLKQVATKAASGDDYYLALQMKRDDDLSKQAQSLIAITSDPKQDIAANTKAQTELEQIQAQQAKLDSLEAELSNDYHKVVLTEDSGKWKANVEEASLEKSQAASIIDLVMKELNIGIDDISIVFKP